MIELLLSVKSRDPARHIAIFKNTITEKLFGKQMVIAVNVLLLVIKTLRLLIAQFSYLIDTSREDRPYPER